MWWKGLFLRNFSSPNIRRIKLGVILFSCIDFQKRDITFPHVHVMNFGDIQPLYYILWHRFPPSIMWTVIYKLGSIIILKNTFRIYTKIKFSFFFQHRTLSPTQSDFRYPFKVLLTLLSLWENFFSSFIFNAGIVSHYAIYPISQISFEKYLTNGMIVLTLGEYAYHVQFIIIYCAQGYYVYKVEIQCLKKWKW